MDDMSEPDAASYHILGLFAGLEQTLLIAIPLLGIIAIWYCIVKSEASPQPRIWVYDGDTVATADDRRGSEREEGTDRRERPPTPVKTVPVPTTPDSRRRIVPEKIAVVLGSEDHDDSHELQVTVAIKIKMTEEEESEEQAVDGNAIELEGGDASETNITGKGDHAGSQNEHNRDDVV
jgi:hypothetical protein